MGRPERIGPGVSILLRCVAFSLAQRHTACCRSPHGTYPSTLDLGLEARARRRTTCMLGVHTAVPDSGACRDGDSRVERRRLQQRPSRLLRPGTRERLLRRDASGHDWNYARTCSSYRGPSQPLPDADPRRGGRAGHARRGGGARHPSAPSPSLAVSPSDAARRAPCAARTPTTVTGSATVLCLSGTRQVTIAGQPTAMAMTHRTRRPPPHWHRPKPGQVPPAGDGFTQRMPHAVRSQSASR